MDIVGGLLKEFAAVEARDVVFSTYECSRSKVNQQGTGLVITLALPRDAGQFLRRTGSRWR
jgi:hypothetical protein